MAEDTQKESPGARGPAPEARPTGVLAFALVVTMLGLLFLLVAALLVVPAVAKDPKIDIEYYKWALSVLLGAFGAWIGAGAAYFFGRENLAESSLSTERALRIQQEALRGPARKQQVRDLTLTVMNKSFLFTPVATRSAVLLALRDNGHYWWVPVLAKSGSGALEDVIHARVFWSSAFNDVDTIEKIVSDLETLPALQELKPLHGGSFFIRASPDDGIEAVADLMNKVNAVVGVVVDDKGKPTHCFTKQDILNARR